MIKHEARIEWTDLCALGCVEHRTVYKLIQKARREVLVQARLCKLKPSDTVGTMLVHMECDFKKPLYFPGTVTIELRVLEVGRTSLKTCYTIRDACGAIVAEAAEVQVYYDFAIPGKAVLSPEQRAVLQAHMQ